MQEHRPVNRAGEDGRSSAAPPSTGPSEAELLLELLGGMARAQALSTLAALGVADRLAAGPRTPAELARELDCDADTLESLLGVAAGLGCFACPRPGVFALAPLGEELRADALGPLAAFVGAPEQWDPWSRLRHTMRRADARTPFAATHGEELYAFLARDREAALRYERAVDAFTRGDAARLAGLGERCGLAGARRVLDVGGGRGTLLFGLLGRWPRLRGVLFDRPDVVERARARVPAALAGRVELVGGDFHAALPAGFDVVVLSRVLHNWDDERAGGLLRRCADALVEGGRLLVVETLRAPGPRADAAPLLDLEMRVLTGGFVRRKPELRRLLHRAGLRVSWSAPLGPSRLLVGARR